MKFLKLFTVLAVSVITSAVFATQNARAFVTITSDEGIYDVVNLYEDDAVTNYSECMSDQYATMGDPVNVWVVANSTNYSKVKLASLNNLVLKFKANSEESFTMSFTYVTGTKTISLKRSDVDTTIIAAAANTYEFTCSANQEITFTINPSASAYTRDLAANNWGTFCYPEDLTAVEGADVYAIVAKNTAVTKIALQKVTNVSDMTAGVPFIFQATAASQKFSYDAATTVDEPENDESNGLYGVLKDTVVAAQVWVISNNKITPTTDADVKANRAFINLGDVPTDDSAFSATVPGRKIFNIVGAATGVAEIEAADMKEGKMMINGKLVIIKGGKMFNAQGAAL